MSNIKRILWPMLLLVGALGCDDDDNNDPLDMGSSDGTVEGDSGQQGGWHASTDGSTSDGSLDDGSLDDGSQSDGSPEDGSTSDGSPEDGSQSDGSPEDGSTSDGSQSDGSTSDGSPEDGSIHVPRCGDGIIDDGDDSQPNHSSKDLGEECDDGNRINGDGCNYTCKLEPEDPLIYVKPAQDNCQGAFDLPFDRTKKNVSVLYGNEEGESHWFKFKLEEPATVMIHTTAPEVVDLTAPSASDAADAGSVDDLLFCYGDTLLQLYSGAYCTTVEAENDDRGMTGDVENKCSAIYKSLNKGVWHIKASAHGATTDAAGNPQKNLLMVQIIDPVEEGGDCSADRPFPIPCAFNAYCDKATKQCKNNKCGDFVIAGDEQCDDGSEQGILDADTGSYYGCHGCRINPIPEGKPCKDLDYSCGVTPDGVNLVCDAAKDKCIRKSCGDRMVSAGEQCDDGNQIATDGCHECQFTPYNGTETGSAHPFQLNLSADGHAEVVFSLDWPNEEDWFKFEVPETGLYTIYTMSLNEKDCAGDTELFLYNAGKGQISYNDNGGNHGKCSEIKSVLLTPGLYYVSVRDYFGKLILEGDWLVIQKDKALEKGDSCSTDPRSPACNYNLWCSETTHKCVENTCGDFHVAGDEECDDGAQDEDPEDGCNACKMTGIPVGKSCIVNGPIECVFNAYCGESGICVEHGCGDDRLGPLEDCDFSISGTVRCNEQCVTDDVTARFNATVRPDGRIDALYPRGGHNDFEMTLDQDAYVTLDTGDPSCSADTVMTLSKIDQGRILIAENDDKPGSTCSRIEVFLEAGVYRIWVRNYSEYLSNPGYEFVYHAKTLAAAGASCTSNDNCLSADNACCESGYYCRNLVCRQHTCGDGVISSVPNDERKIEECDDGQSEAHDVETDGCYHCKLRPIPDDYPCVADSIYSCEAESYCDEGAGKCKPHVCGDGIVGGVSEQCDNGQNTADDDLSDGCASCVFQPYKGDQVSSTAYALTFDENDFARVVFTTDIPGEVDHFSFEITETTNVLIYTEGLYKNVEGSRYRQSPYSKDNGNCSGDTVLELYRDGDFDYLGSNDNVSLFRETLNYCSRLGEDNFLPMAKLPAGKYRIDVYQADTDIVERMGNWLVVRKIHKLEPGDLCMRDDEDQPCPYGYACNGSCMAVRCGDGVVSQELGEECEPPNSATCSDTCHIKPRATIKHTSSEDVDSITLIPGTDTYVTSGSVSSIVSIEGGHKVFINAISGAADDDQIYYNLSLAEERYVVIKLGRKDPSNSEQPTCAFNSEIDGSFIISQLKGEPPAQGYFEYQEVDVYVDACETFRGHLPAGEWRINVRNVANDELPAFSDFTLLVVIGQELTPDQSCEDKDASDKIIDTEAIPCAVTEGKSYFCGSNSHKCVVDWCGSGYQGLAEECDYGDANGKEGSSCSSTCTYRYSGNVFTASGVSSQTGNVEAKGVYEYWKLSLTGPALVSMETVTNDCSAYAVGDTYMHLYSAALGQIDDKESQPTFDDIIYNVNFCSRLDNLLLDAGDYAVAVSGYKTGSYLLKIKIHYFIDNDVACDRKFFHDVYTGDICNPNQHLICWMQTNESAGICSQYGSDQLYDEVDTSEQDNDSLAALESSTQTVASVNSGFKAYMNGAADTDVFKLELADSTELWVYTSDGGQGCPGDTILRHNGSGAQNDDVPGTSNRCSQFVETFGAGTHAFTVTNGADRALNAKFDYVIRFKETLPENAPCDPDMVSAFPQNRCQSGTTCIDSDKDGNGICVAN